MSRLAHLLFLVCFLSVSACCLAIDPHFDEYVQVLGSLTFHTKMQSHLEEVSEDEEIVFADQEVNHLWERAFHCLSLMPNQNRQLLSSYLQRAQILYEDGEKYLLLNQQEEADLNFGQSFDILCFLWEKAIDQDKNFRQAEKQIVLKTQQAVVNKDFEKNTIIPNKVRRAFAPYVIPENHPMKSKLDAIFLNKRVTLNKKVFHSSGFKTLRKGPRSYVYVARHPDLNGYLVKAYMDNELNEKQNHPSWYWLNKRCEGAKKISDIIAQRKIKHFTVASKWIYPLPENPAPPKNSSYTRHFGVLLVTDMDLVPYKVNLDVWSHGITPEHLNELYVIITYAKGSSYRPDNIAYTRQGQFAFIDTEYPSKGPDYKRIRKFLNPEMQAYWDRLVRSGGK
jgi:hypothetical protein